MRLALPLNSQHGVPAIVVLVPLTVVVVIELEPQLDLLEMILIAIQLLNRPQMSLVMPLHAQHGVPVIGVLVPLPVVVVLEVEQQLAQLEMILIVIQLLNQPQMSLATPLHAPMSMDIQFNINQLIKLMTLHLLKKE
jgi:hypothetical protein